MRRADRRRDRGGSRCARSRARTIAPFGMERDEFPSARTGLRVLLRRRGCVRVIRRHRTSMGRRRRTDRASRTLRRSHSQIRRGSSREATARVFLRRRTTFHRSHGLARAGRGRTGVLESARMGSDAGTTSISSRATAACARQGRRSPNRGRRRDARPGQSSPSCRRSADRTLARQSSDGRHGLLGGHPTIRARERASLLRRRAARHAGRLSLRRSDLRSARLAIRRFASRSVRAERDH